MATTLYFRQALTTAPQRFNFGNNQNDLDGVTRSWQFRSLSTARGAAATSQATSTKDGPTAGVEVGSTVPMEWISAPLDADVTISGNISVNLRMAESSMSANADAQIVIQRVDSLGAVQETVLNSEEGAELGTSEAARAWTPTPTSTAFNKGDRIRIRVAANDQATMVTGFTFTFWWDGPTGGASGDSFVTFTETFGFLTTDPTGSTIYPTNTASDVATAAVDREAWTSRGAGVQTDVLNTVAGRTDPLQWTDTAGGTVVDWWTKQLQAFTLTGAVLVNFRGVESNGLANVNARCEVAVCASDGTGCTTWAGTTTDEETAAAEAARQFYLAGDDTSVSDGQRLRIRFLADDDEQAVMATGHTATLYYAGTTGGASGDTYLIFTQTLAEFSSTPKSLAFPRKHRSRIIR